MPIAGVDAIPLETHADGRGDLVALDRQSGLPFDAKRVFYLYNCPPDAVRGEHAVSAAMVLAVIGGSVRLDLDNGSQRMCGLRVTPDRAFHIRPGVWLRLRDFQPGTVVLVASEDVYDDVIYFDEAMATAMEQKEKALAA